MKSMKNFIDDVVSKITNLEVGMSTSYNPNTIYTFDAIREAV